MRVSSRLVLLTVFGLALAAGCGSRTRVTGTVTSSVKQIDLGHSLNSDRTIVDPADEFAPADTVFASVQTETMASARITARVRLENGEVITDSAQRIPSEGIQRSAFRLFRPGGWPAGTYQFEVVLDTIVSGVKEFRVKQETEQSPAPSGSAGNPPPR